MKLYVIVEVGDDADVKAVNATTKKSAAQAYVNQDFNNRQIVEVDFKLSANFWIEDEDEDDDSQD